MQHYTGCMVVTSLLQGHGLGVMAWGRHPVSCDHMLLEFSHMEGRGLLVGGTLLGWWKSIGAFQVGHEHAGSNQMALSRAWAQCAPAIVWWELASWAVQLTCPYSVVHADGVGGNP